MNTLLSTLLTFLVIDLVVMIYAIKVVSKRRQKIKGVLIEKETKHVIDYQGMVPTIRPVCHLSVVVDNHEEVISISTKDADRLEIGKEITLERCEEELEKRNSFIMGIFSQKPTCYKEKKTYYYIEGAV